MKQTTAIYTLTSELHDEKAVGAVTQAFLASLGMEYELKGKIPASARISNGVKITFNNGLGTGGITEAYTDDEGHSRNTEEIIPGTVRAN